MSNKDILASHSILESMGPFVDNLSKDFHPVMHWMYNITVPDEWRIAGRENQDLHLIYVKSGMGWYNVRGQRIQLVPGRIIFISNDCYHESGVIPGENPTILPIRFGIKSDSNNIKSGYFDQPFYLALMDDNEGTFHHLFHKLYDYYTKSENLGYNSLVPHMITEILIRMYHHAHIEKNHKEAHSIKSYLDNQNHGLLMSDLAHAFNRSTKQLSRIFKDAYGMTPKQYHMTSLIQRGSYLLNNTSMSIQDIATRLNYPDCFTFSKQYKRVTGISPGSIRQRNEK